MKIHLITNCTKTKRNVISASTAMLSEIKGTTSFSRVSEWLKHIDGCEIRIPAIDLYVGAHWAVAKEEYNRERMLWILSAGWGLINAETPICPYDATFTKGDANSIFRSSADEEESVIYQNREWWTILHENRSSDLSLEKIFNDFSDDYFFIATSPQYLNVIEPELVRLREKGTITIENTFVITSGKGLNEKLKDLQYLVSEDFCSILGGSRISLNIRLAKYLIDGCMDSRNIKTFIENKYSSLCNSAKPATKYNRKKLSDAEVIILIKKMIEFENINSASLGLKELRKSGMACEQKRFGKLFNKTKEEISIL